eukprot:4053768-Alexandrium_andersonii.AAC.1
MGSRSEDSSTHPLQTCRRRLRGAYSGQGFGLRGHSSLLRASGPSGSRTSKRLVRRLFGISIAFLRAGVLQGVFIWPPP